MHQYNDDDQEIQNPELSTRVFLWQCEPITGARIMNSAFPGDIPVLSPGSVEHPCGGFLEGLDNITTRIMGTTTAYLTLKDTQKDFSLKWTNINHGAIHSTGVTVTQSGTHGSAALASDNFFKVDLLTYPAQDLSAIRQRHQKLFNPAPGVRAPNDFTYPDQASQARMAASFRDVLAFANNQKKRVVILPAWGCEYGHNPAAVALILRDLFVCGGLGRRRYPEVKVVLIAVMDRKGRDDIWAPFREVFLQPQFNKKGETYFGIELDYDGRGLSRLLLSLEGPSEN